MRTEWEWEDLSRKEVECLLRTLPALQNPRFPELEKLISILKTHPTMVDSMENLATTSSNPAPQSSKRTRIPSRGDTILPSAKVARTKKSSQTQRGRNAEIQRIMQSEEKRQKEEKNKKNVKWTVDKSKPHEITDQVKEIVMDLSGISMSSKDLELDKLIETLINPREDIPFPETPTTLEDSFYICEHIEKNIVASDFYHMIILIQIAIQIERVRPHTTIETIAQQHGLERKTLSDWVQSGTRLIALVASSSIYIIMLIATLHMKTDLIYRTGYATTTITQLANVLRNPGMYDLAISDIIERRIIPTIRKLYTDTRLSQKLKFELILTLENSKKLTLDFHNLSNIENYLNDFQTNTFRLPDRSPIWRMVQDFGYPDWSIPPVTIEVRPPSKMRLAQPRHDIKDVKYIRTSFALPDKPTKPKKLRSIDADAKSTKKQREKQIEEAWRDWTDKERAATEKASDPEDLQDFSSKLDKIYKNGSRLKNKYVKLPAHIINGKTIQIDDKNAKLGALVVSDPSGWLKDRLGHVQDLLKLIRPDEMVPKEKGTKIAGFGSIHLDIWNRYCEKGTGAPGDVHPDVLRKEDVEKVNFDQRIPYFSTALKHDPKTTSALDNTLADICDYVHNFMKSHLPEQYKTIKAFVDVLPLNHSPTSYPFSSVVVNIQVATNGHADEGDETLCVVLPLGEWEDGCLVLYELGIVLELSVGDMTIFPSGKVTHFNKDFKGIRCSIVLFGDKHGKDWTRFRNGWDQHLVVKEHLYGKKDSNKNLEVEEPNSYTDDAMLVDSD